MLSSIGKKEKQFSEEEVQAMYRILIEIRSGLTDKKKYAKEKLTIFEFSWLNALDNFLKEYEK